MRADSTADDQAAPEATSPPSPARLALDRSSLFLVTYLAIVVFLFLYLFTVRGFAFFLQRHFENVVSESIDMRGPVASATVRIKNKMDREVNQSRWVQPWGARVEVVVFAKDRRTFLYINGRIPALKTPRNREERIREAQRMLPPTGTVRVSVPHNTLLANAILVFYASLLLSGLFAYNRRVVALENRVIDEALEQRDIAAREAERIEKEIEAVRQQMSTLEPDEREDQEEVNKLHAQRAALESQLSALAAQELELRGKAERATRLEQEGRALEELLDEASSDLEAKDAEIRELERSLKRANKDAGTPAGKAKESETLARRLRTLYQNLEIDDRAIEGIVALRDEGTRLRVEECLKRLSDDLDSAGLRRKVGGLPNHLSVYELGFAGKRRIYYTKGKQRRFRVLIIGAKNTQASDLLYMSKIPKNEYDD